MLKPGKRYWFFNGSAICSGLYAGEAEYGMAVLIRKNGDEWLIDPEHVYRTKQEAIENHKGYKVFT